MIVKVLSENTSASAKFGNEHGLSLYIETQKHRLLFDTGASGLFAENAEKLGVDLTKVDVSVVSHGHYDHGGGLKTFLSINSKARIYLHQKAFEQHYANRSGGVKAYIGLGKELLPNDRFILCGDHLKLDEELELFSGVKSKRLVPSGNTDLFMKIGEAFINDDFAHEQNLIISNNGKTLLIAGCAHNGIINIIDQFKADKGNLPDYVIGGFHLYNHGNKQNEAPGIVEELGKLLLETQAQYYTCHCTGIESYNCLKAVMGDHIDYISAGDQLTIDM
ncbi:MBL fold metallo-hydrolase [Dehalobacter sp. DCM]|uniref:MBL fold metallo-hydrolase n=1 Tax=Dehalobacter sp. DCM TaxID=2907827 RepID=UPI00308208DD|nr:MBL fold metallo-hydrolase [Dehalobacter sp. DCM]